MHSLDKRTNMIILGTLISTLALKAFQIFHWLSVITFIYLFISSMSCEGDQAGPRPGVGHGAAGDQLLAEPGAGPEPDPGEEGEPRGAAHPGHPEARQTLPRHRQLRH